MKHSSICFAILVLAGIAAALPVPSSQLPPWQLPDDWVLANPKEGYNLYGRKLYTGKEILTFMTQDEALDIFQEGLRRAREKVGMKPHKELLCLLDNSRLLVWLTLIFRDHDY